MLAPDPRSVPGLLRGAAAYLLQGVDIDLAPLPALAEVHGGSHQQDIGDAIAVDIKGVDLAAVVGADLEETEEGMGETFLALRGTAPVGTFQPLLQPWGL